MQPLIWDHRPKNLRTPVMVCAFEGWNDAGDAASTAVSFMSQALRAERFAYVETEVFYDFQANRPRICLTDRAHERHIEWPTVEIYSALLPDATSDLVLVQGVEPSLRWRSFGTLICDLAEALGVRLVVTLGALLADVPHTRPVAMTGFASDPALIEQLGEHNPSDYEGPTGIVGVLHSSAAAVGLPSMSLWASIPHYVAAAPSPKAALALVRRLEQLVGISLDVGELEDLTASYERQVGLAVSGNPEVQAFVERLEREDDEENDEPADDEQTPLLLEDLPSGDTLASEFQRFLRQRREQEPPGSD
jgi:proteasome assembly chaperone (PAC2) family protein